MGKVSELWVSQQKLLGDKLVTKWNYLELFDYFMGECLLTFFFFFQLILWEMSINFFFFQLILWEMSINFYIGFHKSKIKKFI